MTGNPVDLGPVSSLATNPLSLEEEVITIVLNDTNVDCAAIALHGGSMTPRSFNLEMFDKVMHSQWLFGSMEVNQI